MLLDGADMKGKMDTGADQNPNVPAAITDTGCERELNEDRYAVIESASGLAWLVCDGMGGQSGGELAAQLAIDAIRRDLENLPGREPEVALKNALVEANRVIVLRRQNQAFADMGTTIVGALFNGPEVVIGHVGDSRAYLVRDSAIQPLTTDHTYVQQLVDAGQIAPDEALSHPKAHILTRCIGAEPNLEVDMDKFWLWDIADDEPRDYLVLCSDGLYSLVSEGEIANALVSESPQHACVKMVELAKARGGYDNITLAIIPLQGQLRKEPPTGYEKKIAKQRSRKPAKKEKQASPTSFIRVFAVLFLLSALAMLLTVIFMFFRLSQ